MTDAQIIAIRDAHLPSQGEAPPCRKCGGVMVVGKAIVQPLVGMSDFIGGEVCTMSPKTTGPGRLVECLKCSACGWSVSRPTP